MSMNLFYIISQLTTLKGLSPEACAAAYKEAELDVVSDVGGISNPILARHVRESISQTISYARNFVDIPDGSGVVMKVVVDGEPYNILKQEDKGAAGSSMFMQKCAVLSNGRVEITGLPKGDNSFSCEVVVQRPTVSTEYIPGIHVFKTTRVHDVRGVTSPVFAVHFPEKRIAEDNALSGGILRVVSSPDRADDYDIVSNSFAGRQLIYVAAVPKYAPVSWIKHQTEEVRAFTDEQIKADADLANLKPKSEKAYPAAVARTVLPDSLRPLALSKAKWIITANGTYHAEYQQRLENWRRANVG